MTVCKYIYDEIAEFSDVATTKLYLWLDSVKL
jgi:hypothetical protein